MKSLAEQNDAFGTAMARVNGTYGSVAKPPATPPRAPIRVSPAVVAAPAVADRDAIVLGVADRGTPVSLDLPKLLDGRLLIQGVSGAGKSYTLRRLLEQTASRIQQVVIDVEGEFDTLAELLGHLHVEAQRLDTASLATLARRVREQRLSVVLDFSDWTRAEQMKGFAAFVGALVECPRELWSPALVAIDEAHLLAPRGGGEVAAPSVRKNSVAALADLMSRGRKRGLIGVIATQRLARLAKDAASDAQNLLVGMNVLDLDIKRAAEHIGWSARKASDRLPLLSPGEFVAVGAAFSQSPAQTRIGAARSRHKGAAPAIAAPATMDRAAAHAALGIEELAEASAEGVIEQNPAESVGFRATRDFIREPAFALAGRLVEALRPLAPDGGRLGDLATALGVERRALSEAAALLERFRAVEIRDVAGETAVRLDDGILRYGRRA